MKKIEEKPKRNLLKVTIAEGIIEDNRYELLGFVHDERVYDFKTEAGSHKTIAVHKGNDAWKN